MASRVRCSAGAAGCWADPLGHTFCSLELRRLGPGLYCTTVWLNTATQVHSTLCTPSHPNSLCIYVIFTRRKRNLNMKE